MKEYAVFKIVIESTDKPSYVSFSDNQPDLNIDPYNSLEIILPESAKARVEGDHIILERVERPL